jgi:hypothetical protein
VSAIAVKAIAANVDMDFFIGFSPMVVMNESEKCERKGFCRLFQNICVF